MYVLGIDPGYGYTKSVSDSSQKIIFPSVVTHGYNRELADLFGRNEMIKNLHVTVEKKDHKKEFFVGELAVSQQSARFNYDDVKGVSEGQETLVATAATIMMQYKKREQGIHLVTGLPLDYFKSQKDEYSEMLKNYFARVTINKYLEPVEVAFDKVTVFPQGAGAIYFSVLNGGNSYLIRNTYIGLIDVGHKTTDIVVFYIENNNKLTFIPELSGTVNVGTMFVSLAIERMFMEKHGGKIDTRSLLTLLETGEIFYDNHLDTSFRGSIVSLRESMAQTIIDWLTSNWGNELIKRFSKVIFAGGGGSEIYGLFNKIGPAITLTEDPQFANAHGFLAVGKLVGR